MRIFTLTWLLLVFHCLISSCSVKDGSRNCNPFCCGEEWRVVEFKANPYPALIPLEENEFMSALERGLLFWTFEDDTLTLKGRDDSVMTFGCENRADTLTLFTSNEEYSQLIVKDRLNGEMHVELIGLHHTELYLMRQD